MQPLFDVFFRQQRVALGGRPFGLLELATMLEDSPNLCAGELTVAHRHLRNDFLLMLLTLWVLSFLRNALVWGLSLTSHPRLPSWRRRCPVGSAGVCRAD